MKTRWFIGFYQRLVLSLLPVMAVFTLIAENAPAQSRCVDLFTKYPSAGFHYVISPFELRETLARHRLFVGHGEAKDRNAVGQIRFSMFSRWDSPTARLLRNFQEQWGVELLFQNRFNASEPDHARQQITPTITNGNQLTNLKIPVELLLNHQLLYSKLGIIKDALEHARRIESLGGEILLMPQGDVLILSIERVSENSQDPLLRLLGRRQKRWDLSFTFSDGLIDKTLEHAAGYARGRRIVLRNDYLSSTESQWLSPEGVRVIVHEIVHGSTGARWARYRASNPDLIDNGRMIEFRPRNSGDILSDILPKIYQSYFRSDEVEAYGLESYFELNPAKSLVEARRFLIQLKWLNEALEQIETSVSPLQVVVTGSKVTMTLSKAVIEIPYLEPIPLTSERLKNDLRKILKSRIRQLVHFHRMLPVLERRTDPGALSNVIDLE
ncbi:MAG: hypothetical protein K2Q26_09325 [Bdellovibrionales bacterium]|nr:hypothetical protein [Bdellovibrionales bacterium]